MEANATGKEAEDDNISVTIQAEDAITLDFDGDDLLETGKNVKITDSEASKPKDGQDAIAQSPEKETKDYEMNPNHKDGKKEDSVKGDPVEKEARESSKKAESGDKEKDTLKKGPSSTGASGQAKRFVFLCQFFTILKFQHSIRSRYIKGVASRPCTIISVLWSCLEYFWPS